MTAEQGFSEQPDNRGEPHIPITDSSSVVADLEQRLDDALAEANAANRRASDAFLEASAVRTSANERINRAEGLRDREKQRRVESEGRNILANGRIRRLEEDIMTFMDVTNRLQQENERLRRQVGTFSSIPTGILSHLEVLGLNSAALDGLSSQQAEKYIQAQRRALAQIHHSDAGAKDDKRMQKINNAADEIIRNLQQG